MAREIFKTLGSANLVVSSPTIGPDVGDNIFVPLSHNGSDTKLYHPSDTNLSKQSWKLSVHWTRYVSEYNIFVGFGYLSDIMLIEFISALINITVSLVWELLRCTNISEGSQRVSLT